MGRSRKDRLSRLRLPALVVLLSVAAPSFVHGAPEAQKVAPRAPWNRIEKGSNVLPGARLREAIASKKQTVEQILELQRAVLTAPKDRGGSAMRGVPVAPLTAGDDIRTVPIAAADFTGDGKDEVVTIDFDKYAVSSNLLTTDYPADLVVRNGADGSPLWTVHTLLFTLAQIADVTGDGTPDIVLFEEYATGANALVAGGAAVHARTRVIDGATGSEAWNHSQDGYFAVAFGVVGGIVGLVEQVAPMADIDANGTLDVFIGTLDEAFGGASSFVVRAGAAPIRYTAEEFEGADGSAIGKDQETGAYTVACALLCAEVYRYATIVPADDLSGDGAADILVIREATLGTTLEARSVNGEGPYWSAPIASAYGIFFVQLNGTGPRDVLVYGFPFVGLDGATGARLWSRDAGDVDAFDFFVVGDADGDGGSDLVTFGSSYDSVLTFTGFSGATGADLWSRAETFTPPPGTHGDIVVCYCWADFSGDGVADLMVAHEVDDQNYNLITLNVFGISGLDGSTVFAGPTLTSYYELPIPVGGDMNGNGTQDLATFSGGGTPNSSRIDLQEGSTTAPLWSAAIAHQGSYPYVRLIAASIRGGAADELIAGVSDNTDTDTDLTTQVFDPAGSLWVA